MHSSLQAMPTSAGPSDPTRHLSPPTNVLQVKRKPRSPVKPAVGLPRLASESSAAVEQSRATHSNGLSAAGEAGPSRLPSVPAGMRNLLVEDVSMPSSPGQQGTDYEDADEGDGTIGDGEDGDEEEGDEGDEEEDEDEEEEDSEADSEEDLDGASADDEPELLTHGPHLPASSDAPVKTEPFDPSQPPDPALTEAAAEDSEHVNDLKPKKRRKIQPVESDEEPYIPPPVPTIRLSKSLIQGESIIWNVLETAKEEKLISSWAAGYDPANPDGPLDVDGDMELDGAVGLGMGEASGLEPEVGALGLGVGDGHLPPDEPAVGMPGSSGLLSMVGEEGLAAEEIARRLEEKYGEKPKRKAKIKRKKVDYDLDDPFIDDSELKIDAPTHYARPKKEGFFVHMGKVELAEEEPTRARNRAANKAKAAKQGATAAIVLPPLSEATRLRLRVDDAHRGEGTRASPIMLDEEFEEPRPVQPDAPRSPSPTYDPRPVDRTLYKNASNDVRLLPPFPHFPRAVRKALMNLLDASRAHKWDLNNKNKFPDVLKPKLKLAGTAAFHYDYFSAHEDRALPKEYFASLPSCLPYNQFTLMKLSIKLCHDEFRKWLEEREQTGLEQFKQLVDAIKEGWIQRYEAAEEAYKADKAVWDQANPAPNGAAINSSALPADEPMDLNGDDDEPKAEANGTAQVNTGPKEPKKMFTWTPEMRILLADLVDNMGEMVALGAKASEWKIDKANAEKEATLKSALYRKVVDCFPEGYSHPNIVSNQMSKAKKQGQAAVEITA